LLYINQDDRYQVIKTTKRWKINLVRNEAKSPKVMPAVIFGAESALSAYRFEIESSDLSASSKETYLLHAEQFVRWMKGEFKPGSHVK
jgi:hypothetical protein